MYAGELYKVQQKNRWIAYTGTILFHAVVLALLWFLVLMPPDPPLGEGGGGMLIALGEENMGGPSEIPVAEPQAAEPIPEPETEQNNVATQDIEEAPVVEEKKEEKKKTEKPIVKEEKKIEKPKEQPRKVDERAIFKKKTNNTSEASGRGDGEIPGNEGRPDGDPNGSPDGTGKGGNGIGGGMGDGIGNGNGDGMGGYDLKGRSLQRRPDVSDNTRETGKVVVSIIVDRTGKVIKAIPGQKGTTTLNPALLEKAKQGAMDTRFSAKPDGPEEQYGTITFVFRYKQ